MLQFRVECETFDLLSVNFWEVLAAVWELSYSIAITPCFNKWAIPMPSTHDAVSISWLEKNYPLWKLKTIITALRVLHNLEVLLVLQVSMVVNSSQYLSDYIFG